MTTQVRIFRGHSGNYATLTAQILTINPRYHTVEWIGDLHWQGDDTYGWYGLRYNVNGSVQASEAKHLAQMHRIILRILAQSDWKSTPAEVLAIIGAEEVFCIKHEYVSIVDNGKRMYQVFNNRTNEYQTVVIAKNEVAAYKAVDQKIKRNALAHDIYRVVPYGPPLELELTDLDYSPKPVAV